MPKNTVGSLGDLVWKFLAYSLFAQEPVGMRQVENDEVLGHLWQCRRKIPRHCAAPVVPDNRRFIASEMADHRLDIADEQAHVVALDALRLVAQVVAALIDRHHLKSIGQRRHLIAPAVPEVWE